jgi:hypothetical protein
VHIVDNVRLLENREYTALLLESGINAWLVGAAQPSTLEWMLARMQHRAISTTYPWLASATVIKETTALFVAAGPLMTPDQTSSATPDEGGKLRRSVSIGFA